VGLFDSLGRWRADRKLRRALLDAPAHTSATCPDGRAAKPVGNVRALGDRVLEAPFSGRRCVYYAIEIAAREPGQVKELASTQDGVPFVLLVGEDGVVVDPTSHSFVSAGFDHEESSKAAFDATPAQRRLLDAHDLIERDWFETKSMIYREAIIAIDERIAVYGAGIREPDPDAPPGPGYRGVAAMRLRMTGTRDYPLLISDDPRALQERAGRS